MLPRRVAELRYQESIPLGRIQARRKPAVEPPPQFFRDTDVERRLVMQAEMEVLGGTALDPVHQSFRSSSPPLPTVAKLLSQGVNPADEYKNEDENSAPAYHTQPKVFNLCYSLLYRLNDKYTGHNFMSVNVGV